MKESQVEAMRQMNRNSSDANVRLRQAIDDRSMSRSIEWCRSDKDSRVYEVGARASREITARQLGIVAIKRDDDEEEQTDGRRPRRKESKKSSRNDYDYED